MLKCSYKLFPSEVIFYYYGTVYQLAALYFKTFFPHSSSLKSSSKKVAQLA
jgi:hypothetical protein